MIKNLLPIFLVVYACTAGNMSLKDSTEQQKASTLQILLGAAIISSEFIGVPIIDYNVNWHHHHKVSNLFKNIREYEPYHQDELWHLIGSESTLRFNNYVLGNFFGIENSLLTAVIMTGSMWTMMECFDGIYGSGFSYRDEIGNVLGLLYGSIRIINPDFPIYIRVGIDDWKTFLHKVSKLSINNLNHKKYEFTKVDIIYMTDIFLYGGFSISNKKNKPEDRYGATVGFDFLKLLNADGKGWFSDALNFVTDNLALSINFTYWVK